MSVIEGYNKNMFNLYSNIENIVEYYIVFDKIVESDVILNEIFKGTQETITNDDYYQGCVESLRSDLLLTDDAINDKILTNNFGYKYYNPDTFRVLTCNDGKSFTCISFGFHYTKDFNSMVELLNTSAKKLSQQLHCNIDLWAKQSFNSSNGQETIERIKRGIRQIDPKVDEEILKYIFTPGEQYSQSHKLLDTWFKLYYSNDLTKYLDIKYGYESMDRGDKARLLTDNTELYEQSLIGHIEIIKQKEIPPITDIYTASYKSGLIIRKLKNFCRPSPILPLNTYGTYLSPTEFDTTFKLISDKFYTLSLHKELSLIKDKLSKLNNDLNELIEHDNVKNDDGLTREQIETYISEQQELYGITSSGIDPEIKVKEEFLRYIDHE